MATPNSLYFAQFPLQEVLHDKDTGFLLSAGIVSYFSDPTFEVPKNVFMQSNDAPYGFINVGPVLTLSAIGSFIDPITGNNAIPFLFPWEGDESDPGAFQPYFIRVQSSGFNLQFTVTNWPPNQLAESTSNTEGTTFENQITNPQFAEVLFAIAPAITATINVTTTDQITQIAPSWFIKTSGTGTIALTQNALTENIESQAPYSLSITTTGITAFSIYQRIFNSPRLFAEGAVSLFFEVATSSILAIEASYIPSTGTPTVIISSDNTNGDGQYQAFAGSAEIVGVVNLDSPTTGYVDIALILTSTPIFSNLSLTSFQLVAVDSISTIPIYAQKSVPLQQSELFYYWQPSLNYKPIPSYLIGWDFPLNPYQAQGTGVFGSFTSANNTSYYVADQTILFQSVNASFTSQLAPTTFAGLNITALNTSSFAVIQYLSGNQVQELIGQRMSVQIKCSKTGANLAGRIGLYCTGNAAFPILPLSIFSSIAAGIPVLTAGWIEIPLSIGAASFVASTTSGSTPFSFSGFDATAINTSGFINFALAIIFEPMTAADVLTLNYCSLNTGDIPTRPAPQTPDEVIRECQYYYEKSYDTSVVPGSNTNVGAIYAQQQVSLSGGTYAMYACPFTVTYNTVKRAIPSINTLRLYEPAGTIDTVLSNAANSDSVVPATNTTPITTWGSRTFGTKSTDFTMTTAAAIVNTPTSTNSGQRGWIAYQFVVDCRLGVI